MGTMKCNKYILLVVILFAHLTGLRAECNGWSVVINESSFSLCAVETHTMSMSVANDTAVLDSCKYRWKVKKPSSTVFEEVATTETLSYLFDEVGVYTIRALARPNECTIFHESPEISVTLYPLTVAGSIEGNQTICYNAEPSAISQSVVPTGGDGNFTYQWQMKTEGVWSDIQNATTITYQPLNLTTSTSYRLKYVGTCSTVYSNEVVVTVRPDLTSPIIANPTPTICYNTTTTIECTTKASGGSDDSFTYQWQESLDGVAFVDINGATALTYTTNSLTIAHWYRLTATSVKGCGSVISNVTKVDVYPELTIANTELAPLCYMTNGSISVSVTGAGNKYTYQWMESTDGNSYSDIASANSATYTIQNKTAGTYYYKVLVTPLSGCASKYSDVFTVIVYDDLVAGVISGKDTICYDTKPETISLTTPPTGGDGSFSHQWQKKTDGEWNDIVGAVTTSYQPDKLSTTTSYRLVSTTSCGSVISNEVEIYVRKKLIAPTITSTAETVCYGFAPNEIQVTTPATCDAYDSLTYQWQQKVSNNWENIVGATSLTYQPTSITAACQYRVIATSVKGCEQVVSNIRTVNVYDDLHIATNGVAPLCYMTSDVIGISATGEGNSYTYQWQDSAAGVWSNITNGTTAQYELQPKENGTYYYRCIVIPTLGCQLDTSDVISVLVYDSVAPGKIALTGKDTICYGFVPEALSVIVPATGGDNVFTYQWLSKPDGATDFSPIAGAISTVYTPSALYQSTEYKLKVTNACEIRYTNSVRIYVRDEMQAPSISAQTDTICYNTVPDKIITTTLPMGGVDDSFTYQWLVSEDGKIFTELIGETATEYQPTALLKTTFYRLRSTSIKSCGDILSNVVAVNVFDSLYITTENPDTLCYMVPTTISVTVKGGGNSFSYQWQELVDSKWQDITGAVAINYETEPKQDGVYYYRCIVSSNKCENYVRISPTIIVPVYTALTAGTIVGIDSTCYSYAPAEMLRVDVSPSGVDGNYAYQWQKKDNGMWIPIQGATSTSYQPEPLFEETDYRLQVASKCDTLYTNNILIRVNSLPQVQPINGADNVCYNQREFYSVDVLNSGFTYEWMIDHGNGELLSNAFNTDTIEVLWKTPSVTDSLVLHVTDDITGCERNIKYGVTICNEQAPEQTIIIRKPNSDILISKEDGDLFYQWGYTDKFSQKEYIIDDSNRRYVLLPHTFDNSTFDYWLTLRPSETSPCYSKSYYYPTNDTLIGTKTTNVSMPTRVHQQIPIVVQNPNSDNVSCYIYDLTGHQIVAYPLGSERLINTSLPFYEIIGLYLIRVEIGDTVETFKLIAE